MITGENVTDEQIRELRTSAALAGDTETVDLTYEALGEWGVFWEHLQPNGAVARAGAKARARTCCAKILNAREQTLTDEQIESALEAALAREDIELIDLCETALKTIIQPNLKRQAIARIVAIVNARATLRSWHFGITADLVLVNDETLLGVDYDIGTGRRAAGAAFTLISGPTLDDDTLDDLAEDMQRFDGSSFGPVLPRFYRKHAEAKPNAPKEQP